jgi:hypothetical protein
VTIQNLKDCPRLLECSLADSESYASTLAEAVQISATVRDVLGNDRSCRVFVISDKDIESRDFGHFLDWIRCHDCVSLSEDNALSFLEQRLLKNAPNSWTCYDLEDMATKPIRADRKRVGLVDMFSKS